TESDAHSAVLQARVRAGSETELTVDVPRGITLEGTVTDASARPLAGAAIVFGSPFPTDCGAPVAETAADGSFRVRSISRSGYFGARAPGFASSPLQPLPPKTVRTQSVRIVLTSRGGSISGVALDVNGRTVPGAEVVATVEGGDEPGEPTRPVGTLTGADGAFILDGIAEGEASLVVRARGLAPWIEPQRIRSGDTAKVTVRLGVGATLEGTLRDTSGEPVVDARVDVAPDRQRDGDFALSALTNSDGSFRIEHVFDGPIRTSVDDDDSDDAVRRQLFARIGGSLSAADGSFRIGHVFSDILVAPRGRRESRGTAEAKMTAHEGETLRWDAVLTRGLELRGRLLDSDGAALVGWTVVATPPASVDPSARSDRNARSNGVSDATGRFSIPNCLDAEYRLELYEADQWAHNACFGVEGVRAGANEILIRVPPSARASAWITGKVLASDGRPASGELVAARPTNGALMVNRRRTDADGGYRIGPLPPGHYDVLLRLTGIGVTLRDDAELAPGETLDLGTFHVRSPGSLTARLRREDGRPFDRPDIWIFDACRATYWRPPLDGDVVRATAMPPGRWVFSIAPSGDSDVACTEVPFEIRPGAETTIEVPLRGADPVTIHFVEPKGEEWASFLRAELRSESRVVAWKRCFGRFRDGELRATLRLPPGRYAIEAASADGATGTATFVAPSPDPTTPIDVSLRRHASADAK
ncbi:MAG: carboxypeptidase regulatory-like domain-containing protein, partial [Planctomycetes bacterium]|nr:carboxypeptidase regulatory-like domain-containing protein [Planctomycetota bacterium]